MALLAFTPSGNTPEQLLEHARQLFLVAAECNGVGHDTVLCIAHNMRMISEPMIVTEPRRRRLWCPPAAIIAVHLVERRR